MAKSMFFHTIFGVYKPAISYDFIDAWDQS